MVLIYIRHCADHSEKSSTFVHDAKINQKGRRECQKVTLELIDRFGIPKVIVTSPFLRARQTTKIMKSVIRKSKGVKVKVIVDKTLGRFFTSDQRIEPQIRPETTAYGPIVDKCNHELKRRIRKHLKKVISKGYHQKPEVIWCISHGVIIKKLVEAIGQKAPTEVPFLESFQIRKDVTLSRIH